MNIVVFITTRYGSTRLPGKHLMTIGEDTVTDILIERVKEAGLPVTMVTPNTPEDLKHMKPLALKHDIGFYSGDVENIIQRHIDCAVGENIDWIINVDGDDILTCPDLILKISDEIEMGMIRDCVHLSNYPLGMNLIAYTPHRLSQVHYTKDTNWGAKVMEAGPVFEYMGYRFKDCRLTLDYIEDYFVVKYVIEALGKMADPEEICSYMANHPEVCQINLFRNKEYNKRLEDMSK